MIHLDYTGQVGAAVAVASVSTGVALVDAAAAVEVYFVEGDLDASVSEEVADQNRVADNCPVCYVAAAAAAAMIAVVHFQVAVE